MGRRSLQALAWSALSLCLVGCPSEELVPLIADIEVDTGNPDSPRVLQFDPSFVGEPTERLLTLRNVGTAPISVDGFQFSAGPFWLANGQGLILEPGAEYQLPVLFEPEQAGDASGTLRVLARDDSEPWIDVLLVGEGLDPTVLLIPGAVNLGALDVGCGLTSSPTVVNVGAGDVTVTSAQIVPAVATNWSLDTPTPFVVGPASTVAFELQWWPTSPGAHSAKLVLQTEGGGADQLRLPMQGEAVVAAQRTDAWTVGEHAVDLLFLTNDDGEGSYAAAIGGASEALFSALDLVTNDWRVGVSSMNPYQTPVLTAGSFVDGATADRVASLTALLQAVDSDSVVRAFDTIFVALSGPESEPGGSLSGFPRSGATLVLVFVSDRQEASTHPDVAEPIDFVQWIAGVHSGEVVGNDITGGLTGCSGGGGSANAGTDFVQITVLTGGTSGSICAIDQGPTLESIGLLAAPTTDSGTYPLSRVPDLETLQVLVGVAGSAPSPVSQGWTFEPEENAVIFDVASRPVDGDRVELRYFEPACR